MFLMKLAYTCQSSSCVSAFESRPADPEEAADAYLLRRMSPGEDEEFELHLAKCPRCSQIVETTRAFIQAIRTATRRGLQVPSGPDFTPKRQTQPTGSQLVNRPVESSQEPAPAVCRAAPTAPPAPVRRPGSNLAEAPLCVVRTQQGWSHTSGARLGSLRTED
jgi:hypothetical protein